MAAGAKTVLVVDRMEVDVVVEVEVMVLVVVVWVVTVEDASGKANVLVTVVVTVEVCHKVSISIHARDHNAGSRSLIPRLCSPSPVISEKRAHLGSCASRSGDGGS